MAVIEQRKRTNGTTAHRVTWRLGGTRDGARQSLTTNDTATAKRIKLEVEAHRHKITADHLADLLFGTSAAADVPGLAEWARSHVESLRDVLTAGTLVEYERTVRLHIDPMPLGRLPVDEVNRDAVQRWVGQLARKGLAPKSIANHHGLLSAALKSAVQQGMLTSNPCDLVSLPRTDDHLTADDDMSFLTAEEVDTIAAEIGPERLRPLVPFLARTGLRWGEATALTVGDVDLLASPPFVRVTKAWKRQTSAGRELGPPKTRRSRRVVSLDGATVELLIPLVAGREPAEFVFVTVDGKSPVPHGTFHKQWLAAVRRLVAAGRLAREHRVHDLRHTHASWLIAAGVPLPAIQRRLGHESITTTIDRYGHLMREVDDLVLAALDARRGSPDALDVVL